MMIKILRSIKISLNIKLNNGVVIIALDESGSMGGNPWNDVVEGAKKLIEFIIADHARPQDSGCVDHNYLFQL